MATTALDRGPSPVGAWVDVKVRAARRFVASTKARWVRTTRVARARAGYAAGMATASWGVGVLVGFGWFLVSAGLIGAWSFLHLYPVDES